MITHSGRNRGGGTFDDVTIKAAPESSHNERRTVRPFMVSVSVSAMVSTTISPPQKPPVTPMVPDEPSSSPIGCTRRIGNHNSSAPPLA